MSRIDESVKFEEHTEERKALLIKLAPELVERMDEACEKYNRGNPERKMTRQRFIANALRQILEDKGFVLKVRE